MWCLWSIPEPPVGPLYLGGGRKPSSGLWTLLHITSPSQTCPGPLQRRGGKGECMCVTQCVYEGWDSMCEGGRKGTREALCSYVRQAGVMQGEVCVGPSTPPPLCVSERGRMSDVVWVWWRVSECVCVWHKERLCPACVVMALRAWCLCLAPKGCDIRWSLPTKGFKNEQEHLKINPEPHWKPVERGQDRANMVSFPGTGQDMLWL